MEAEPHPLLSLLSACFWVIFWLLSWTRALVTFATISIPRFIYNVLSYSLTFTLNFYSLAVIFALSSMVAAFLIRIRYLNDYEVLREPPLTKPDAKELHPDVHSTDVPPTMFHNYLDEFLQAIRVFGFLEKPVFHELARHLQTRRLIAGDSLYLDQDKSFYCVIDGMVEVYAQTGRQTDHNSVQWEEEDMNGYQLLNEVGSGGTLSSLFTILSLFTEDVKISWQHAVADADRSNGAGSQSNQSGGDSTNLDFGRERGRNVTTGPARSHERFSANSSTGSTEPLSQPPTPRSGAQRSGMGRSGRRFPERTKPGAVARATEDTTLAVIPAEAFKRLTKKFPKASAHIVQVILTRFARVTFNAAHRYLGLTSELLRTEKLINDIAFHPLTASFYEGGGLQNLRSRFVATPTNQPDEADTLAEEYRDETDEFSDYFGENLTTDHPVKPLFRSVGGKTPKATLRALPPTEVLANSAEGEFVPQTPGFAFKNNRNYVNPGDLHSMAGSVSDSPRLSRTYSILHDSFTKQRDAPRRRSLSTSRSTTASHGGIGEFDLRAEVMSCIAKSIGLIQPPLGHGDGESEGVDRSPGIPPFSDTSSDAGGGLPSSMFNSSFGSLSMLEVDIGVGDDSSSASASAAGLASQPLLGLDNEVEILSFDAGSILVMAGERNAGLFYVIDGLLDVSMPLDDQLEDKAKLDAAKPSTATKPTKSQKHLFTVKPGGIAGYLASLTGTASYVDIKAKTDAYVGFLPSHALERLLEKRPIVLLTLAKRLISLLSPLVLHIDASLDWMQVTAGQVLWRPGDKSDSFYIVLNGRLRAFLDAEGGGVDIVAEHGQGDTVGELDVITNSERTTTLHAIRDTELARMPLTLFNAISARNPQTTVQLLRKIASGVRTKMAMPLASTRNSELARNNFNLKTVAILPATRDVPVASFAKKLHKALEGIGAPTSSLNQASVTQHLGRHAFTRMGKLKVAGWLADLEQRYRIVLYIADSPVNSPWTQTCIRQADYVMVVGMGDNPNLGEYERLLLSMKTTARKELVLLHPDRSVLPGSTREWLKSRPWVHAHLHVELSSTRRISRPGPTPHDPAAVVALKILKSRVQSGLQKYRRSRAAPRPRRAEYASDFARLARRLCGKSVGVVLGGGGARGVAHLGALRALEEFSIPIDYIGGTSIGALVGGLYARDADLLASAGRTKQFSSRMSNIWRMLSDVTWPVVAYTTGHEFNRAVYKTFYDLHIEDMWLPYFCNSSNILTSRMEIHETGYAWRFIRASMTLVGLLPPLCDNGGMLVDGGYIDNLPVSTMFSLGASAVIAIDVAALDDNSPRNFGDTVSGWWILLNRFNPFSSTRSIPAITEIQSRLAYVSSVKTLEEAKVTKGCLYMAMPVQEYGTMQFSKFEEIQERGYQAALELLDEWDRAGRLPTADEETVEAKEASLGRKRGRTLRRNSI
ncbi:patatin-domain-containing protein [Ramaria rubella]|nr:patatin-domain-containing protein [Ramaria rubella]